MTGLKLATMQQGLKLVGEITDIEIAAISESVWKDGEGESARGYEIGIESYPSSRASGRFAIA